MFSDSQALVPGCIAGPQPSRRSSRSLILDVRPPTHPPPARELSTQQEPEPRDGSSFTPGGEDGPIKGSCISSSRSDPGGLRGGKRGTGCKWKMGDPSVSSVISIHSPGPGQPPPQAFPAGPSPKWVSASDEKLLGLYSGGGKRRVTPRGSPGLIEK